MAPKKAVQNTQASNSFNNETKGYNKPSNFSSKFIGKKPEEINSDIGKDEIAKLKLEDILDQSVVIEGYIVLQGEYKGKPSPYALICCTTPEERTIPFTVISSNKVIMKKLKQFSEGDNPKDNFPILAQFTKVQGIENEYYDVIDPVE